MDRQTRRILRYRPTPASVLLAVVLAWVVSAIAWSGHAVALAPIAVVAPPWYLVWRRHRIAEARRLGLLPRRGEKTTGGPQDA